MKYISILIAVLVVSCGQARHKDSQPSTSVADALADTSPENNASISFTHDDLLRHDSLQIDSLTPVMLAAVSNTLNKDSAHGLIKGSPDKSGQGIYATWDYGTLFSADKKHLLVRWRRGDYPEGYLVYSDIYLSKNDRLSKLVMDTAFLETTGDTLQDVNGDGYKDYVVSSYSGVGCCPRDAQVGYLYDNATGDFKVESFFNPTYIPSQRLVYESNYGQTGLFAFYKSKWVGLEKVLVESIHPTPGKTPIEPAFPYTFMLFRYPGERTSIIKAVPEEYKRLGLYEYFILYQEQ
ncbi:hypothetical protein [Paraflavitalea sp. CAU 1676]|uniref:hypothetical protein n=1 Tax=Paraflavitalea sp. CAU 1676 TaxID=3032598 RepID=UPI0023D9808B|nr:hypothetical protein [Paraflavitalea sp. CAU 1676]MDF2190083.1 hypothetical protein [Paraflavitalea sp. CAU 1676]